MIVRLLNPRTLSALVIAGCVLIGTCAVASARQAQPCEPGWVPTFGQRPGTSGGVSAFATFDDGSGPALYVAGGFSLAGSVLTERVARWDGAAWTGVGGGIPSYSVTDLCVFDDGAGAALYAVGNFYDQTHQIARWDGTSWTPFGAEPGTFVATIAVLDVGSGPALHAVRWADTSPPSAELVRWNGATWTVLAGGISGTSPNTRVDVLATYDDGTGPAIYVGGNFTHAGGVPAASIAKWDGASWSAPIGGVAHTSEPPTVHALRVFDDGTGPALYVGGQFTSAGGVAANDIARWNGSAWSALGSGSSSASVEALLVHDDGTGPALYAGAWYMTSVGGTNAFGLARWNGSTWSTQGMTTGCHVFALAEFDDGSGNALYAGGQIPAIGGLAVNGVAVRRGGAWASLGQGPDAPVNAVVVHDDGSGPALYAGGDFISVGGRTANRIAKWDGASWSPLGSGINGRVSALVSLDTAEGPMLYAGGYFSNAGGVAVSSVARWDGASWHRMGAGVTGGGVTAMAVYDDGSGPAVYAAGSFSGPGSHVARWNGSWWYPLGPGVDGAVNALAVHDDGTGPQLYAVGQFFHVEGAPIRRIARWNGINWTGVGEGLDFYVNAVASFDDGTGPALYVGGGFLTAGGMPARHVARWNGSAWSNVGAGVEWWVTSLTAFDDGSGPKLIAGLAPNDSQPPPGPRVLAWDGAVWSELGTNMRGSADALAAFDDGNGPALIVAGGLWSHAGVDDSYLARWKPCERALGTPYCSGDSGCPCGNDGASGAGCLNSLGVGARLGAAGRSSLSHDSVVLTASAMPNAASVFVQGRARTQVAFGDGFLCATGALVRLGSAQNVAGAAHYPGATDAPVASRGGIAAPGTREYQVWYRNVATFCTPAAFNLTNGLTLTWTP